MSALPRQLYANVTQMPAATPAPPIRHARKAQAEAGRDAELLLKRKIDQADQILASLEARSERFAVQIKELQKRKAAADSKASRFEDKILVRMTRTNVSELVGIRARLIARPSPAKKVIIDDFDALTDDYLRETQVTEADKVAIKQAIEGGTEVAGAHLAQTVTLVRK